jgi:hypothetical protein
VCRCNGQVDLAAGRSAAAAVSNFSIDQIHDFTLVIAAVLCSDLIDQIKLNYIAPCASKS